MPTIQVATDELIKAVGQLDPEELEHFVSRVVVLWAQRQKTKLSPPEKKLVDTISQGLPKKLRLKYSQLVAKRQAETLTPAEHRELLRLTDQIEEAQANRVEAMVELARRRNTSLADLLKDLPIRSPLNG